MSLLRTIERLVSFEGRWPGTSSEQEAGEYLVGELGELGRGAKLEPIRVRPAYHVTHALHAALAVIGSVVSVRVPVLGVVILLLVGISMYGDLTTRFYLLRRLMPAARSHNVTSRGDRPDAAARVVLTAHYDAARSGLLFTGRLARPAPRLLKPLAALAGPIDLVFWTITLTLVLAVVRLISGSDSTLLTAAQFACAVILIGAVILFVDVALSQVVPGASDNASGVAAVLEVARRLDAEPPPDIDVWVLFTGAKEGLLLGMREWWRLHSGELDPRRTFFVNVDTVGKGSTRYVTAEGFLLLFRHDQRLIDLCRRIARSEVEGDAGARATPHVLRFGTDGSVPAMRGFPSITICCTDEHGRLPNYHRPSDVPEQIDTGAIEEAVDLVEALVRRIGPLVPQAAAEPHDRPAVKPATAGPRSTRARSRR
jgi:hypothetical protein